MKDDTISRQAVLKLLSAMPPEEVMTKAMLIQGVKQMDAAQPKSYREGYQAGFKDAQPERKRGQWIDGYKRQTCSLCKGKGVRSWNYCPYCGADMREVDE